MNLTEIVFILDCSGSMSGMEKETIHGFNSFLSEQKEKEGEAIVSVVSFNERQKVIYNRVNIKKVLLMNEKDYMPNGCTALLDTVGSSIQHIKKCHHYDAVKPEKTVFIIITDGYENSSREYTYESIKRLVADVKEKEGFEFVFLGANIDAVSEANKFGFNPKLSRNYQYTKAGHMTNFKAMSNLVSKARSVKSMKGFEDNCQECFAEIDELYDK